MEFSQSAGSLTLLGRAGGHANLPDAGQAVHDRAARGCTTGGWDRTPRSNSCQRSTWAIRVSCAATISTRSRRANASGVVAHRARRSIGWLAAASLSRTPKLRFPIWGAFGGNQFYGPLPIEGAFFTDAGVAWGQSLRAGTPAGDNQPVFSVGAALRVNVFNFAVAEIDFVSPLDRPTRGWMWQFQFRPGF